MTGRIIDLDHLMLCVHDHAEAQARYERMGFVWREVRENAPMGGAAAGGKGGSGCAVLRSQTPGIANYLELAYADPATASPVMKSILGGPEGLAMIVHALEGADAVRDRWVATGLDFLPTLRIPFKPLAGGGVTVEQTLNIVIPEPGALPIPANGIEWVDVAEFEHEPFRAHPNSARTWTEVTCVAPAAEIDSIVAVYERFYGLSADRGEEGTAIFRPGCTALRWVTPDVAARFYPSDLLPASFDGPHGAAVTIDTADLDKLRACLEGGNVAFRDKGHRVLVGAREAGGILMDFVSVAGMPS